MSTRGFLGDAHDDLHLDHHHHHRSDWALAT
jgi:hypothetical protein